MCGIVRVNGCCAFYKYEQLTNKNIDDGNFGISFFSKPNDAVTSIIVG
jgi:hypothetical protein